MVPFKVWGGWSGLLVALLRFRCLVWFGLFFSRPEAVGVVGGDGGRPLLRGCAADFRVLCSGCGGVEYFGYYEESLGMPQVRLRQSL